MKEWGDKIELLNILARARHDARESVPKSGGNEVIEAAMFLAMMHALDDWWAAHPPEAGQEPEPELAQLTDVQVLPALPELQTEEIPPAEPTAGKLPENSYGA